jgi:uncharacterized protein
VTELDLTMLALIAIVMVVGGVVKGAIGLGLPLVSVGFMTMFLPAREVLGLVIIPILVTNLYQAYETKSGKAELKRFWPIVVCMWVGLVFGVYIAASLSPTNLYAAMGGVLVLFCLTGFADPSARLPKRLETPIGLVLGALSGVSGGVSTVWGPPISMYLLMIGLEKDQFVRAVGIIWCAAAVPVALLYAYSGILNTGNAFYSLMACLPAMLGLWLGQKIRQRISQELFRRILLATLLIIGLNLIRRAYFT